MTTTEKPTHLKWRIVIRWTQRIFAPFALIFICYFVWRSRGIFGVLLSQARPGYLLMALSCWVLLHLTVSPACTVRLLQASGAKISYITARRIHVGNLPARYLPGGIWHTIGRVSDLQLRGVSATQLTTFVILENTTAAGVALTLGGASVCHFHGYGGWGGAAALSELGGLVLLVIVPLIVKLRMLSRLTSIDLVNYAIAVAWAILFWCIAGASFVFYLSAFPLGDGAFPIFEAGGGYIFSWGVGFISIFSPQGIGVSEAVMANVLSGGLAFGSMVALAAGFRVVVFGADVLAWVLSFATRLRPNRG